MDFKLDTQVFLFMKSWQLFNKVGGQGRGFV